MNANSTRSIRGNLFIAALALATVALVACSPDKPKQDALSGQPAPNPAAQGAPTPHPAGQATPPGGEVVATVNGTPITRSEVDFWMMGGHGQRITPELKKQALEDRIEAELVYQRGLELGLDRDRKYQDAIRHQLMKIEASKRREMARRVGNAEIAARVDVKEADARAWFDAHADAIKSEYHLASITFRSPQAAQAAQAELKAGEAFEAVAAKHDPAAKAGQAPSWDMGFLGYQQMPAEWSEAVTKLEPGQITGIVHGQRTGIRIFKLIARRPNPKADFDHMKGMIMNRLRDEKIRAAQAAYIKGLKAKAKITRP